MASTSSLDDTAQSYIQVPTPAQIKSSYKTFVITTRRKREASRLELLPGELRNLIYEYLGLSIEEAGASTILSGATISARYVLSCEDGRLKVLRAARNCAYDEGRVEVDVHALMALSRTNKTFRSEIGALHFNDAILLLEAPEFL